MNRTAWIGFGIVGTAFLLGRRSDEDLDDVEALARVVTSEANGYSESERIAIAWCVRNRAKKRRVAIAKLVCSPTCGPCCNSRKPFSSAREAATTNRELARRVLATSQSDDPTHGATAFAGSRVQDKLVEEKRPNTAEPPFNYAKEWQRKKDNSSTAPSAHSEVFGPNKRRPRDDDWCRTEPEAGRQNRER